MTSIARFWDERTHVRPLNPYSTDARIISIRAEGRQWVYMNRAERRYPARDECHCRHERDRTEVRDRIVRADAVEDHAEEFSCRERHRESNRYPHCQQLRRPRQHHARYLGWSSA